MHHTVDDTPFGGGPGMVMKPEPWGEALDARWSAGRAGAGPGWWCRARPGAPFTQADGGRVRARSHGWSSPAAGTRGSTPASSRTPAARMPVDEVSIGDYVLAGGEPAVLVMIEAICRLLPGRARQRRSPRPTTRSAAGDGPDGRTGRGAGLHPAAGLARAGGAAGAAVRGSRARSPAGAVTQALRRDRGRTGRISPRRLPARRPPRTAGDQAGQLFRRWLSGQWRRCGTLKGAAPRCRPYVAGRCRAPVAGRHRDRLQRVRRRARDDDEELQRCTPRLPSLSRRRSVPTSRTSGPGDTLKVHVRVIEGNRSRIQVFQGVVIRRQGGGARETFTVRKISYGVGVERTFPVHSPSIDKIEVVTRGQVRRAKLYYLRSLRGKAARIKERREPVRRAEAGSAQSARSGRRQLAAGSADGADAVGTRCADRRKAAVAPGLAPGPRSAATSRVTRRRPALGRTRIGRMAGGHEPGLCPRQAGGDRERPVQRRRAAQAGAAESPAAPGEPGRRRATGRAEPSDDGRRPRPGRRASAGRSGASCRCCSWSR